jgi:hypothetical protein
VQAAGANAAGLSEFVTTTTGGFKVQNTDPGADVDDGTVYTWFWHTIG